MRRILQWLQCFLSSIAGRPSCTQTGHTRQPVLPEADRGRAPGAGRHTGMERVCVIEQSGGSLELIYNPTPHNITHHAITQHCTSLHTIPHTIQPLSQCSTCILQIVTKSGYFQLQWPLHTCTQKRALIMPSSMSTL